MKRFKPDDAESFPREFFRSDKEVRARWLLLHSTPDYIDSFSASKSDVFMGPDVSLPTDIRQSLSFNGKYVLHVVMKKQLVG